MQAYALMATSASDGAVEWFLRNKIMNNKIKSIAILGGTGALGSALTKKWSNAGYRIVIGSRDPEKAKNSQQKLTKN